MGGANWADQGSFFSFKNAVNFIPDDFLCNFGQKRIDKTLDKAKGVNFSGIP